MENCNNFSLNHCVKNDVKNEYIKLYEEMIANLRTEDIYEVVSIFRKEKLSFNVEFLLNGFKEILLSEVHSKVNSSWSMLNIAEHLDIMDSLKSQNLNNETTYSWRPTGKSVFQQTSNIRFSLLQRKMEFFKKQCEFQKIKMQELKKQNTKYRDSIERVLNSRTSVTDRLEKSEMKISKVRAKLRTMLKNNLS